jgi:hypothetical protein
MFIKYVSQQWLMRKRHGWTLRGRWQSIAILDRENPLLNRQTQERKEN